MFSTIKNLFNLGELKKKKTQLRSKEKLMCLKGVQRRFKERNMSSWSVQLYLKWNISDGLVTEAEFLNQHLRHERLKRNSL